MGRYDHQRITGGSGPGAILGGFEPRVFGVGPEIGYAFLIYAPTQGS